MVWLGGHLREARVLVREAPALRPLIASTIVTNFNTGLLLLVVPLYFLDRGFTFFALGAIVSVTAIASILVQLAVARYPGVFARREVVVGLLAVSVAAFPFFVVVETPLQFLLVSAIAQLSGAASAPGLAALVAELAPAEQITRAYALLGVGGSLALATALGVGGVIASGGYQRVFWLGTLLSIVAFALAARAIFRPGIGRSADPEVARMEAELANAQSRLVRAREALQRRLPLPPRVRRNVAASSAYVFLFGLSLAVYPVFFPVYLHLRGISLAWVGVIVATSWVLFGICQPVGARIAERTGRHQAIIATSLLAAGLLNLVMAFAALPFLIAAWALLGIADGIGRPVTNGLIAKAVPESRRIQAFAWTSAADSVAHVVAPYGFALLIAARGMPVALSVVAVLVALAAVPLLLMRPSAALVATRRVKLEVVPNAARPAASRLRDVEPVSPEA